MARTSKSKSTSSSTTIAQPSVAPVQLAWSYPAQPTTGGKGRGIGPGSVGAALVAHLSQGPSTLDAAQAAVDAAKGSKGLRGAHPVQPLARFIAVHGGVGLGFTFADGQLHMVRYSAPTE